MTQLLKYWAVTIFCSSIVLLQGCQNLPQTKQLDINPPTGVNLNKLLSDVPFFPQQEFYCGPTTLSEVFHYYDLPLSPNEIAPSIFIPNRQGSLQLEMITATRKNGLLAYSEKSNLETLIRLIDQDIPVIILQNLSIPWIPQWHYAVVIGYDLNEQTFTLHTGVTPKHTMSFSLFERVWQRANYWMLAPLPEAKLSPHLKSFKYIQAAYDQLVTNQKKTAVNNLKAATKTWPEEWLTYFLLGNHFLEHNTQESVYWFHKGLKYAIKRAEYLNNYSYALSGIGCNKQAQQIINKAINLEPFNQNLLQSKQELQERKGTLPQTHTCQAYNLSL